MDSISAATSSKIVDDLPFTPALYTSIGPTWPTEGNHILATFDTSTIIVYQAYNSAIANYATTHQTFKGCPQFSESRMTWIKTNFLWMMYRSGWGRKDTNQTHILALTISRSGFEEILQNASKTDKDSDVRLQWDPDHTPYGEKASLRRAIQLGLRNSVLQKFLQEWTLKITDITPFVEEQRAFVDEKRLDLLRVPPEKVYIIENNDDLVTHIELDQQICN